MRQFFLRIKKIGVMVSLMAMVGVTLLPGVAGAWAIPPDVPPTVPALWTPGAQLYANGGPVVVTLRGGYAGFENNLYLKYYVTVPGGTPILLGTNRDPDKGRTTNVGTRSGGTELIFYIEAYKTDADGVPTDYYGTFYTGPGNRPGATNADGWAHAAVNDLGGGAAQVGFEDTYGWERTCDWDFNDLIFDVQGVAVYRNGFVTGGGFINSPVGAYPASPSLVGKANFGFNAKYLSHSTLPQGSVEFNFHSVGPNFHSKGLDWLMVSSPRFIIRGSGTIDGSGDYGFLLFGYDSRAGGVGKDKFRIRIWDKSLYPVLEWNTPAVYDNEMSVSNGVVTFDIADGSIVIHKD